MYSPSDPDTPNPCGFEFGSIPGSGLTCLSIESSDPPPDSDQPTLRFRAPIHNLEPTIRKVSGSDPPNLKILVSRIQQSFRYWNHINQHLKDLVSDPPDLRFRCLVHQTLKVHKNENVLASIVSFAQFHCYLCLNIKVLIVPFDSP
jgi:hypothetical protein